MSHHHKHARKPVAKAIDANLAVTPAEEHNVCQSSEEAVRLCAYQKWEQAGRPSGDGMTFWLQAELELSAAR